MTFCTEKITDINSRNTPREFEEIITEKSQNFVDRAWIFTAMNNFMARWNHGYFSLIGYPGSGKSAILAQRVRQNPSIHYYNCQIQGKNRADQFLENLSTQLINRYPLGISSLPENATEDGSYFAFLLQKIADILPRSEKIIIAIDALDAIDPNSQPSYTNLFYLPRYLPDRVYFLLTSRPISQGKLKLLIEAPHETINLEKYPEETRAEMQEYIRRFCADEKNSLMKFNAEMGINSESDLSNILLEKSALNWMYLSEILKAIREDSYRERHDLEQIPPGLNSYYQQHREKMLSQTPSELELQLLKTLGEAPYAQTLDAITKKIDGDEYEIEEILENWGEFLRVEERELDKYYQLYHPSFQQFFRDDRAKFP
jgi:hypothetical protein